jgi:hypothetical protein
MTDTDIERLSYDAIWMGETAARSGMPRVAASDSTFMILMKKVPKALVKGTYDFWYQGFDRAAL